LSKKLKKIFPKIFKKCLTKLLQSAIIVLWLRGGNTANRIEKNLKKTLKKFEKTLDKLNEICYNNLVNKGWGNQNPPPKKILKKV
jgi:hypothetical protein